jgi:hypothetical protein
MQNELVLITSILIAFLIILFVTFVFIKKIYRKGDQIIKVGKKFLQIDNDEFNLLDIDKIILSSNYYSSNKPTENELVIISPIFDDFYRFRHYYSFDMIQYNLDKRPRGYLYLWHWNKNQIENLLKSILNVNKNIILEGKGLKKLNLNKWTKN